MIKTSQNKKSAKYRFGVVLTWPGANRVNAEREVIMRIIKAAEECGYEAVVIDNHGHILDSMLDPTEQVIQDVSFIISLHYDTPKALDAFYYYTIWNPPDFPMREGWKDAVDRYISFDDYLFSVKGGIPENHLKSILLDSPRELEHASMLAPSLPASVIYSPNLDNPKLFYCGMNWDVLVYGKTRNEGLMKLLDKSGHIKIFGPNKVKEWGDVSPWAGYESYQYSIPFDGFSILNEINECGICLVLSSDIHRRSGIATNRLFEACAAGAVIISDDNRMAKEMFGDALLYIKVNRNDPQDTYQQIINAYTWVIHNKDQAKDMALKAQRIFVQKYSLNAYLKRIINNHSNRYHALAERLFALDTSKIVLVMYVCNTLSVNTAKKYIDKILQNICHQVFKNIILAIGIDVSIQEELVKFYEYRESRICFVSLEIYDAYGARRLSDGEVLASLREETNHDYFMITNSDEIWFYDHVTTLVRCLENNNAADISYAGQVYCDNQNNKEVIPFHRECVWQTLYEYIYATNPRDSIFPYPGCFLFRSICHDAMPNYLFDYLDGREYIAYLYVLCFKKQSKIVFSKRVTFQYGDEYLEPHHLLINANLEYQFILGLIKYDLLSLNTPAFDLEKIFLAKDDIFARYIFPWKSVRAGTSIIIYGGGKVGKAFLEQVRRINYCHVVAVSDKFPTKTGIRNVPVISQEKLYGYPDSAYDLILIAVSSEVLAKDIREDLVDHGICSSKIIWSNPNKLLQK